LRGLGRESADLLGKPVQLIGELMRLAREILGVAGDW
jgi:hypothetical protein